MLKFYLISVVIWMIIIRCTMSLFKEAIKKKAEKLIEKGKGVQKLSLFGSFKTLFVLAAIPVVRLFMVIAFIYIATCSQEDFDELMKKVDDN